MDKVKEVLSAKVVEAATYLKGMSIHEDEIAFLGLDARGNVLAQHLLNAGVRIRLWEPTVRSAAERQLGGENVALFKTITEAIKPVHIVFVSLTKSELDDVTQDEAMTKTLEVAFSGSTSVAEKAQLKLLVGGPQDQYEKVKPILSVFGTLFYAGAVPKAIAVKQSVDLVLAAENSALALACTHLHRQGFDTSEVFMDVLKVVRSTDMASKIKNFETRVYNETLNGFSNDEILQGLTHIARETTKTGMDANLLVSLIKYTDAAKRVNGGSADISSVYDVLNPPTTSILPK